MNCSVCGKIIDFTPYLELHEWFYNDHGDLIGYHDYYCDSRCIVEALKK